jgi:hypothetical protein
MGCLGTVVRRAAQAFVIGKVISWLRKRQG